ncbi:sce7725 family protein [Mesorhizobium sp.]|uniref:sce7725 family protein n=1 Tax=Mesorhizobium sp. TaxID=1871066 RepID=UPI000FE5B217|nr:sce7725 family protein [Mesorhizobium sp.]RWJ43175.1 MAG: ATP-binding protein [Mesorhizobium sp.]
MYHPYFRGKQFELLTIRETAKLMAEQNFVPVIEPVKESLGGLEKALKAICDAKGQAIVIVNPYHGDHQENGTGISQLLQQGLFGGAISAGILLRGNINLADAVTYHQAHLGHNPTFIHAGFTEQKGLAGYLHDALPQTRHVFIEDHANTLYRKHFEGSTRILIRDGFKPRRNAEFAKIPVEEFSELHLTFHSDLGMNGFGDFLMVGDVYSEGGGPAYAVAIHLTFIDPDADEVMYIYHFVSTSNDTPTDPAGKFGQALQKLILKLNSGTSKLLETSAIKEFRDLHAKGHFPGLGYVKKLSMKHHIETLADYLG